MPEIGWHAWAKTHWSARDGARQGAIACEKTAAKIWDEATVLAEQTDGGRAVVKDYADPLDKRVKRHFEWAVESGNDRRLNAMLRIAAQHLTKHIDELDGDPLLFNVPNGTLELGKLERDGTTEIRPRRHARRDMITRIAPVG